ncbi:MAG: site-2 protease family protein [Clostridia bacterium]|nr:site-2 protease family protein [Clostridia bacterium]
MRFRFFGTEIYISFLFSAVIAFMIATDRTGLVIPTLFSVLLHEVGHLIFMWIFECEPKSIKLVPASISITRGMSAKKYGDLLISLAGPMVNLIMFCSLYVNFLITKSAFSLDCALINLAFFIFNMLPVSGLDGGIILKIILSKKFKDPLKAERIVRIITLAVGLLVGIIGITLIINGELNISVFIVAIYILISAFVRI